MESGDEIARAGDAARGAAGRSQQAAARQGRRRCSTRSASMPRVAADAFEAHALIDGTAAVVAAHPAALELYPRLRTMGVPFVASLSSRQARPAAIAHHIGADAFVIRPYKKEMMRHRALRGGERAPAARSRAARRAGAGRRDAACARRDSTSGMLHIDLFKTLLPLEIRRARRHGYPIAICVVSIDPLPNAQAR